MSRWRPSAAASPTGQIRSATTGSAAEQPTYLDLGRNRDGGKTSTKGLLRDLLPQGLPALILDFKDDCSKPDYAATEGFTVHDVSFTGLPFNPMDPRLDPRSGRVNPVAHIHELVSMSLTESSCVHSWSEACRL